MKKIDDTHFMVDDVNLPTVLNHRKAETTKRQYGHALLVAGSAGKMGAAVLAARACLRSGVGMLTVHAPACGYGVMQTAVPEAMMSIDKNEEMVTELPASLDHYDAVAVGPGLGTHRRTARMLRALLKEVRRQAAKRTILLVVDADALNIIAGDKKHLLPLLPEGAILTPHAREYERLFGSAEVDAMASKYRFNIVRKAHHTATAGPSGRVFLNYTGNAGMATAGSGDVLTGIILGLAAQHLPPLDAAVIGVFIHGRSADLAVQKQSQASLIASDIIDNLRYATL